MEERTGIDLLEIRAFESVCMKVRPHNMGGEIEKRHEKGRRKMRQPLGYSGMLFLIDSFGHDFRINSLSDGSFPADDTVSIQAVDTGIHRNHIVGRRGVDNSVDLVNLALAD